VDTDSLTQIQGPTDAATCIVQMREVVGRALALLEAANRQLAPSQLAARASIARAAAILQAGIGHSSPHSGSTDNTGSLLPWQARRVQEYIEENLDKSITVRDLSAVLYRTQAHFSRAFKRTFGLSPHAYVLRRRIERAGQLMLEGNTPLSEIALRCGFTDQAHFSKRFRLHTGATPTAWRREQLMQPRVSRQSASNNALTAE
jgi:AraC family transcriptional regulator